MEEAREDDILRLLTVKVHPFRNDAGQKRDAERMVVDVIGEVVDVVEVVDDTAAA